MKIISLHAIDQPLVDNLCDIICRLSDALQHEKALELRDEKQIDLYNRITEGS